MSANNPHITIALPRFHGARLHNSLFCEYVESLLDLVKGKEQVLCVIKEATNLRNTYDDLKKLVYMPWSYVETSYIKQQHKHRKMLIMAMHAAIWRCKKMPMETQFYKSAAEIDIWKALNAKTAAAPIVEQTGIIDTFFKNVERHSSLTLAIEKSIFAPLIHELKKVNEEISRLCKSRNEEAGKRLAIKKNIKLRGKGPNDIVHTQELRKECAKRLESLVAKISAAYNVLHVPESKEVVYGFLGTIQNYRELDKLFRIVRKSKRANLPYDEEEIDALIEKEKEAKKAGKAKKEAPVTDNG